MIKSRRFIVLVLYCTLDGGRVLFEPCIYTTLQIKRCNFSPHKIRKRIRTFHKLNSIYCSEVRNDGLILITHMCNRDHPQSLHHLLPVVSFMRSRNQNRTLKFKVRMRNKVYLSHSIPFIHPMNSYEHQTIL